MRLPDPILDRPIRFALVGCGRISKSHIEAIQAHVGRAELVAVCDHKPESLAAAMATTGVAGFASLDALLASDCAADVVVLATPSGLHPQQACAVAAAGLHVLSEKPMATKFDEGMAMVRADRDCVWAQFTLHLDAREAVQQALQAAGVPTAVHYPKPLHQQPAYAAYGRGQSFPEAEKAARRVMSLPMSADLSEAQQDQVLAALRQALSASV